MGQVKAVFVVFKNIIIKQGFYLPVNHDLFFHQNHKNPQVKNYHLN